uniref:Gypsy retrotransposon integrase-like protein 1 n=1 Tax=Oryzias latipes TaxID=8090 RepID=A0A3P9HAM8_ORYLA
MVTLLREFIYAQRSREEMLLGELQGLRTAMEAGRGLPSLSNVEVAASPTGLSLGGPSPLQQPVLQSQPMVPALRKDPKLLPFQSGEDIENYLLRFERVAKTWAWPETEWAYRLVPLLTGKALEAYSAMDEDLSDSYLDLKQALLAKFDISAETYRQRFRSTAVPQGETPTETYHRLKGLYRRWIKPDQCSVEDIGEVIILEQLLRMFPPDVRTWVKEREPTSGLEAAKLATQYVNARRPHVTSTSQRPLRKGHEDSRLEGQRSRNHGTFGNVGATRVEQQATVSRGAVGTNRFGHQAGSSHGEIICYYCQQPGHKASDCPLKKSKLSGYCYVPGNDNLCRQSAPHSSSLYPVKVNGKYVSAILDSGSSLSLVKKGCLSNGVIDYKNKTNIKCVHGDQRSYPTAEVTIAVDGHAFLLQVGVIDQLSVECVLGRDLPVLHDLITQMKPKICAVVTRSQTKAGLEPLPDLHSDLCEGGSKGPRKSRRQRRIDKITGTDSDVKVYPEPVSVDWDIPNDISFLQMSDPSLSWLYKQVENGEGKQGSGSRFLVENDILYATGEPGKRLVVPVSCRPLVLHLAHTIPWAGHLGQQKTYMRLGSRFFWPTMFKDVKQYCSTCPDCQVTSHIKVRQAPLHPLPVIGTPFRRIAMDVVGPLEKSSSGYKYILVICDYATRFPEAFPLRSIKTPKIIGALVQLFSRVGVPDEIITDQATNFTSGTMKQLQKELGIKGIRTTP